MATQQNEKQENKVPEGAFDFDEMNNKYNNGLLKDNLDCKMYIAKYFYPTTHGTHIMFEDGQPIVIQKDDMKTVYLARFPKEVAKWYNTVHKPIKVICDINQPVIGKGFINLSPRMKHIYGTEFKNLPKEQQKAVYKLLDYIKLIWANNNEEVYQYLLSWLSCMIKGIRNQSVLYAKGDEGIGKSTLTDFLRDYVIGLPLYCKGKADHLFGQHNLQLMGKLLVVFEELQFFSENEWRAVDSEFKDMITDKFASYADKYEKRFCAENINNYIVNTNVNAIKGAHGRRYVVLDCNPSKMNDFKYFKDIRDSCFNNDVGYAFFAYLYEVNVTNFNSLNIPITQSKKDLTADLLKPIEKFLKFEFLMKKQKLHHKPLELHEKYKSFCLKSGAVTNSLPQFTKDMRELGFEFRPSNGSNYYNISLSDLEAVAERKRWHHELDNEIAQELSALNKGIQPQDPNDVKLVEEMLIQLKGYRERFPEIKNYKAMVFPILPKQMIPIEKPKQKKIIEETVDEADDDSELDVKATVKSIMDSF